MHWVQGLSRRRLGKYVKTIFQDGGGYSLSQWEEILDTVAKLKVGDPVSFYGQNLKQVASVEFGWEPIQHKPGSKIVGWYISQYCVRTEDGSLIWTI